MVVDVETLDVSELFSDTDCHLLYYFADIFVHIFICSVVPLIGDSLGILMQRQPKELDEVLPGCFHRVSGAQLNDASSVIVVKIIICRHKSYSVLCGNIVN